MRKQLARGRSHQVVARILFLGVLMLLTPLTSGCAYMGNWLHNGFKVGPDYARPAAPVAEEWIDFNDPRVISDNQNVDDAAWWNTLNDPVLNELIQRSYQQNLPLRVAGLRVMEAQAQRAIAAGLLFPQFQEAFGQYSRVQLSARGNSLGIAGLPKRNFDFWSTGFNVGWEVDLWGRIRRNLESAEANLDASVENYDDVLVCLLAETAATYVEVRTFQQRLLYADANAVTQEISFGLAESRFRNGAVSELDVTQARSNLKQTQALIPVLKKGLRQANNRLCVLQGIPPYLQTNLGLGEFEQQQAAFEQRVSQIPVVRQNNPQDAEARLRELYAELSQRLEARFIPTSPRDVVVGIPADLMRRRPDVRRAERQVAAQSAQIGVAAADLFPTFTINGSINWQADKFSTMFSSAANAGILTPQFNWNILNYGRIVNNVGVQQARFQQLAVEYQQTVLQANAEVENAITAFLNAQEEASFLHDSVQATERSVQLAQTQYKEGAVNFNRVSDLQGTLTQQQDQLAVAEAEVVLSLIRIYKTLGGGWQIRYGFSGPETVDAAREAPEPLPQPRPAERAEGEALPAGGQPQASHIH